MTAKKILENVQDMILARLNALDDVNIAGCNGAEMAFLEWIDREITKAIEDHEAEGE